MKKSKSWILIVALMLLSSLFIFACKEREPAQYTVVFSYADGVTPDKTETVAAGEYVLTPEEPTRSGYAFQHWNNGNKEYDFTQPVQSDLELTAIWKESGGETPSTKRAVVWQESEAYRFETEDLTKPSKAELNSVLKFDVWTSPYYVGTPVVKANEAKVERAQSGMYEVTVTGDMTLTVEGLKFDDTPIEGTGFKPSSAGDRESNPYIIRTAGQLKYIADAVNSGATAPEGKTDYATAAYVLASDIDLKGVEWEPIGSVDAPFRGSFETANFNTVSNFKITRVPEVEAPLVGVGFFGMLSTGSIYGLNLADFEINVRLSANFEKAVFVGGVVGYHFAGYVESCFAEGKIRVNNQSVYLATAGGIVGIQEAGYNDMLGTIIPYNGNLNYCGADVDITSIGAVYAGGVLGYSAASAQTASLVQYSYAWGNITGGMYAGGLVGYLGGYSSISDCYATGDVSALDYVDAMYSQACAGGLVGIADAETAIWNCFSAGSVSAASVTNDNHTGGVVGLSHDKPEDVLTQRPTLILNGYYAVAGSNKAGIKTDKSNLTSESFLTSKLGWTDAIWKFAAGEYPVINFEGGSSNPVMRTITLDFGDKYVDYASDNSDQPVTGSVEQEIDTYDGMSLNWVEGYANKFFITRGLQSTDSYTAYAWYLDNARQNEFRAYMPLRAGMTLHAAWADYSDVSEQFFLDSEKNISVRFSPNGVFTINQDGLLIETTYKYDGRNIYISYTTFAGLAAEETEFLCTLDGNGKLSIVHLAGGQQVTDTAYAATAFSGTWFLKTNSSVSVLVLNPDRTGVFGESFITYEYDRTLSNPQITFKVGGTTYTGTLNNDDKSLILNDTTTYGKTDPLYGIEWMNNKTGLSYEFNGLGATADGVVTVKNGASTDTVSYTYNASTAVVTVDPDGDALTYNYDGGYLKQNGKVAMTLKDPFMGKWTDELGKMEFFGINENRIGTVNWEGDTQMYTVDGSGVARVYNNGEMFVSIRRTDEGLLLAELTAEEGETPEVYTLMQVDDFLGTWYTLNQNEYYTFNGFGYYDNADNIMGPSGKLHGTVEYYIEGARTGVNYYYINGETVTFSMGQVNYTGTIDGRKLTLSGTGDSIYYLLDRYEGKWTGTGGEKLTVNGTDTIKLTAGGQMKSYAYTLDSNDNIVLADGAGSGKIEERYRYLELKVGGETYYFVKTAKQKAFDNKSFESEHISFTLYGLGEGDINMTPYGKALVTEGNNPPTEYAYIIDRSYVNWKGNYDYLAETVSFYTYDEENQTWLYLNEIFYYLDGVFVADLDGVVLYENGAVVDPGFKYDVYRGKYTTHLKDKNQKPIYAVLNGLGAIECGVFSLMVDDSVTSSSFYLLNTSGDLVLTLNSKSYRGEKQENRDIIFYTGGETAFTWTWEDTTVTPEV